MEFEMVEDMVLLVSDGAAYGGEQASGLFVPLSDETVDRKAAEVGTVVAAGPGRVNRRVLNEGLETWVHDPAPMTVKEGDRVLFSRYAGEEIVLQGKEYKVVREYEILAVVA